MPHTNREGTPSFSPTKSKWMLSLALLEEMERVEIVSLTGFPLAMAFLLQSRLFCAHAQNQLTYTSFAATPGNGCLPSRKDCLQKETITTSIRAGYEV